MTALDATSSYPKDEKGRWGEKNLNIRGGTAGTLYRGSLIAHRTGSQLAEVPDSGAKRTDLVCVGVLENEPVITTAVDSGGGLWAVDADDKPICARVGAGIRGPFETGTSGNEITMNDIDKRCFMYDSNTLYLTDLSATISPAGTVAFVDANGGVWLNIDDAPLVALIGDGAALVTTLEDSLASTTNGQGGALVGFEDPDSLTTAADFNALGALLLRDAKTALGFIDIPPQAFYLLTGAPLAVFSSGTSTVPGSVFIESKAFAIQWNNDAAPAAIATSFQMPPDVDITVDAVLHIRAAKIGATNNAGNTTTFAVGLFNQVDAATYIADTDFGGASSALLPAATTKTIQSMTRALTAADLAAYPASVTLTLKPTAGTLDTDDLLFVGARLVYQRKLLTS